jgi:hypothetical protein
VIRFYGPDQHIIEVGESMEYVVKVCLLTAAGFRPRFFYLFHDIYIVKKINIT